MRALLIAVLAAASSTTIQVYPRVLQAGGEVRLTCRVPRNAANRKLRAGFDQWTAYERDLEGEDAPVTWDRWFHHVPCAPGDAFCEVTTATGRTTRLVLPVNVIACE